MAKTKLTRRQFVATTAAASATAIAAPFVHTANAAGKLSIGFWDHWVPGANKASEAISSTSGPRRKRSRSRSTTSPRRATRTC